MQMKKPIAVLLIVVFLAAALVGCSSSTSDGNSDGRDQATGQQGEQTATGPKMGGVLKVAVGADYPSFDPHITTDNLVQQIGYHLYESLFTLDEDYKVIPMLATGYDYDEETLTYVIPLREGVKFHNGKIMTADDVVASLNRWLRISNTGAILKPSVKEIKKVDDLIIAIELNEPNAAVPMFLSNPRYQAVIYPKEVVDEAGDKPIKQIIGTGPYKFVEHKADQYARVVRFDDYCALDGPPNGWGGKKIAYLDEIRFIPTPEASVRLEGVEAGEFHWADALNSDMYGLLHNYQNVEPVVLKPDKWPTACFNKVKGPFVDKKVRQAFLAGLDMETIMKTAFAYEDLYRLDHSLFFQEQAEWYSEAGKELYNQHDIEKAKELLAQSSYNGEKIRWVTSGSYEFMKQVAMLAAEQLKAVGFNIEVEALEWPSLVERRSNPDEFEIHTTGMWISLDPGIFPEFNATWPGFWDDPVKDEMIVNINKEMDPEKRKALWDEFQAYFYEEVPMIKFGDYFAFTARHKSLQGLMAKPFVVFYNTWLAE